MLEALSQLEVCLSQIEVSLLAGSLVSPPSCHQRRRWWWWSLHPKVTAARCNQVAAQKNKWYIERRGAGDASGSGVCGVSEGGWVTKRHIYIIRAHLHNLPWPIQLQLGNNIHDVIESAVLSAAVRLAESPAGCLAAGFIRGFWEGATLGKRLTAMLGKWLTPTLGLLVIATLG